MCNHGQYVVNKCATMVNMLLTTHK